METTHSQHESLRQQIVVDYIGTVRRIAHGLARTLPRSVSLDDLIGAGLVGMADALAKFKGQNLGEFGAYAARRVRGAMIDALRNADPLTRPLRLFVRRKDAAIRVLVSALGRSPDDTEIADQMGLPLAIFREQLVRASLGGSANLNMIRGSSQDGLEFPDDKSEAADTLVLRKEQRARLTAALQDLPERLRRVLTLHYEHDYSLREIGEELGVTESRVCQLHREGIERLRQISWSRRAEDPDVLNECRLPPPWLLATLPAKRLQSRSEPLGQNDTVLRRPSPR